MSGTRYYFGDASDLEGMTREEVIDATDADCVEYEDRFKEMITSIYGPVTIGLLTWDAGAVLREMDPVAFRCGVADETAEVDPDDYLADDDEDDTWAERCPACGELIDDCQGHGEIGDPDGAAILKAHDDDDHGRCVIDC